MSTSATARQFFEEVWSDGKLDLVDELFSPAYLGHPSRPEEPVQAPAGVAEFVGRLREGVPDLTVTVEDQIAEGDKVATRWTARGTHDGQLMGIDPTGRTATVTGITIQRFDAHGQIVEGWTSWDMLGMLQQLGVAPQPVGR